MFSARVLNALTTWRVGSASTPLPCAVELALVYQDGDLGDLLA